MFLLSFESKNEVELTAQKQFTKSCRKHVVKSIVFVHFLVCPAYVVQSLSYDFLSMIFGFFENFWIDLVKKNPKINFENISILKKKIEKKLSRKFFLVESFLVQKMSTKNFRSFFFDFFFRIGIFSSKKYFQKTIFRIFY